MDKWQLKIYFTIFSRRSNHYPVDFTDYLQFMPGVISTAGRDINIPLFVRDDKLKADKNIVVHLGANNYFPFLKTLPKI